MRDSVQRALTGFAAGVMVAASVWSLLIPACLLYTSTNAHPGGESIGILVADRFFNENAFYSNLYRSVLKAADVYKRQAM